MAKGSKKGVQNDHFFGTFGIRMAKGVKKEVIFWPIFGPLFGPPMCQIAPWNALVSTKKGSKKGSKMAILDPFFTLLPVAHQFGNVFLRRPYKPAHPKSQLDHSNLSHGDKTLLLAIPQIASWIPKWPKCPKSHFFGHFWTFPPIGCALFFRNFRHKNGKKGQKGVQNMTSFLDPFLDPLFTK